MKARLLTLLMALFAFAWSAKADEITSLKLTISHNGGPAFTQEFPSSGWEELVLSEQTTSLVISKVEVQTSGSMQSVIFQGTMYNTSQGGPSDSNEWRTMPLVNKGSGKWELDMGEGVDLVEQDWLNKPKTKTFEFYVQGTNGSGNQVLYNNGGANYKVTFSTGESADWKIKFLEESTADLLLNVGGEGRSYSFKGDGSRTPEDQLGQISSLAIDQFALRFRYNDGVKTNDVSLQYRIYEEGQEPDGGWSRIDAPQFYDQGSNTMFFYTDMMGLDVTNDLEPNKDYVLEVNYQVVVDGEYIFLGKNKESSKFRFSIVDGGQGGTVRNVKLTVSQNGGKPFDVNIPSNGWNAMTLQDEVSSLKLLKVKADTDDTITSVNFASTIYDTAVGHDSGTTWEGYQLDYCGDGHWELNMGDGMELVESDWIQNHETKTLDFFLALRTSSGEDIFYDNEGWNYTVTFTCGEGGGSSDKITFLPMSTAELSFIVNDEQQSYFFNADGSRTSDAKLGQVSSFSLERFAVQFTHDESIGKFDVSLQYKIYEVGKEYEGGWNRVDAFNYYSPDNNTMYCYTDNLNFDLTNMLEPGKNYVFEAFYQVIADGEYFFFGKDAEDSKFHFYVADEWQGSSVKSFKLTISQNGGAPFEMYFPSEGWEELFLTGEVSSLKIVKAEVETDMSITSVGLAATTYNTYEGPAQGTTWPNYRLENYGDGHWELNMGDGMELVESDWIQNHETRTLDFLLVCRTEAGGYAYFYNGGSNYKISFTCGEGGGSSDKITFLPMSTAELSLIVNDEQQSYFFNADGSRTSDAKLGQVSSFSLDRFAVQFTHDESIGKFDVSLQYKIYEVGKEYDGGWNRVDAFNYYSPDNNTMYCYADNLNFDLTNMLEPGKNYVFEAFYQVIADGEYFFLGKDAEDSKFYFYVADEWQGSSVKSFKLTISQNGGAPFEIYFPSEGWEELFLTGEVSSLKIVKAEVETDMSITSVGLAATTYNTNEGPVQGTTWPNYILDNYGNGHWELNMGDGMELVESDWIQNHETRTLDFFLACGTEAGGYAFFCNGGPNYKISFTCGEGGSSSNNPIKSFKLTVDCDGQVITEDFPESGWQNMTIPGQVSSVKLLRVEVETDESLTYMGFCSTIFDTEDGWQHDTEAWKWEPLDNQGGGHWVLDYGEGVELIDFSWLGMNLTKTIEFFVDGGDEAGNNYKYNNGSVNNNYRVTFTTGSGGGDQNWKIRFADNDAATLSLVINDELCTFAFDRNGNTLTNEQGIHDIYSLMLDGYSLAFQSNKGVQIQDVCLLFKLYEEGQDGKWMAFRPNGYIEGDNNQFRYYIEHSSLQFPELTYGKDYVLEFMYRVIADNEYFYLTNSQGGMKFKFYYDTETGIQSISDSTLTDKGAYNLAGQHVGKDYKGIVVKGGKKVLMK